MARINLLPWREERRKQQEQEFFVIAGGSLVVVLALVGVVHFAIEAQIDHQNKRNQFLKSEIAILDKKIKEIADIEKEKEQLVSRMDVIQKLQESRPQIVRFVDELIDSMPDGLYLTKLDQKNDKVSLEGKAQSNARVSAFMRGVERSEWMDKPGLSEIKDQDRTNSGLFVFKMDLMQTSPNAKEEGK